MMTGLNMPLEIWDVWQVFFRAFFPALSLLFTAARAAIIGIRRVKISVKFITNLKMRNFIDQDDECPDMPEIIKWVATNHFQDT